MTSVDDLMQWLRVHGLSLRPTSNLEWAEVQQPGQPSGARLALLVAPVVLAPEGSQSAPENRPTEPVTLTLLLPRQVLEQLAHELQAMGVEPRSHRQQQAPQGPSKH